MIARIVDSNRRHLKQGVLGRMALGRRRLIMQSKREKYTRQRGKKTMQAKNLHAVTGFVNLRHSFR